MYRWTQEHLQNRRSRKIYIIKNTQDNKLFYYQDRRTR